MARLNDYHTKPEEARSDLLRAVAAYAYSAIKFIPSNRRPHALALLAFADLCLGEAAPALVAAMRAAASPDQRPFDEEHFLLSALISPTAYDAEAT